MSDCSASSENCDVWAASCALVGSLTMPRIVGRSLVRVGAAVFMVIGFLEMLSIGFPLLIAGVLCLVTFELGTTTPSLG